jgi:hypothetical protein
MLLDIGFSQTDAVPAPITSFAHEVYARGIDLCLEFVCGLHSHIEPVPLRLGPEHQEIGGLPVARQTDVKLVVLEAGGLRCA